MTSPSYMTINEAAHHLRVSRDYVEQRLVNYDQPQVPGKLRSYRINDGTSRRVRILSEDVYVLLPKPSKTNYVQHDNKPLHPIRNLRPASGQGESQADVRFTVSPRLG